jgi:fructose-1,6-bisphosphatase/inositol monophosphatase family enzyme
MVRRSYGTREGIDLDMALDTAVGAAKEAGEIIRKTFRTGIVDKVKTDTDPVTETDLACEAVVKAAISQSFPAHAFLGEEESGGSYSISDAPTWVCDPVDGTANFLHGVEFTCVCVALVVNKRPLVGVVYNPVSREMFTAVVGGGAYVTIEGQDVPPQRLQPSTVEHMQNAAIVTELGSNRDPATVDQKLKVMHAVVQAPIQALRCMGSCALNMCYVAAGRFDGYYEWGMHPWDVAAAWCVCAEAGAVLTDLDGEQFSLTARRTLVANRHVHPQLCKLICDAGAPGSKGS